MTAVRVLATVATRVSIDSTSRRSSQSLRSAFSAGVRTLGASVSSEFRATACTVTRSGASRVGSSVLGLDGGRNGDRVEYCLAHRFAQPWVALFRWGGSESERDSSTSGVNQFSCERNVDTEPLGLSDAGDKAVEHCNSFVYR